MEPLAVAYRAVSHADCLKDKHVLIVGAGTIGLLAMACVKLQNPASITVSDFSDSRLQLALEMGVTRELNVRGTFLFSLQDFETVVGLINEGKVDVEKILSAVISLEEAPKYFKQLAENPGDLIKVVVCP